MQSHEIKNLNSTVDIGPKPHSLVQVAWGGSCGAIEILNFIRNAYYLLIFY